MDLETMTDDELWSYALRLAMNERQATWDFVEALAAIDARNLHEKRQFVSLFACCIHRFKLSESAAYRRIRAARALRLVPEIGGWFRDGRLTLEGIALLHPHLRDADARTLVEKACGLRTSEIEALIAPRRTLEPRREVIRLIAPAPTAARPEVALEPDFAWEPAPRHVSAAPLAPPSIASPAGSPPMTAPAVSGVAAPTPAGPPPPDAHAVRIAFTAGEAFHKRLRLAQAAMRHKFPDGRLDGIFYEALDALLRKKTPWAYRKPRATPRRKPR